MLLGELFASTSWPRGRSYSGDEGIRTGYEVARKAQVQHKANLLFPILRRSSRSEEVYYHAYTHPCGTSSGLHALMDINTLGSPATPPSWNLIHTRTLDSWQHSLGLDVLIDQSWWAIPAQIPRPCRCIRSRVYPPQSRSHTPVMMTNQ